MSLRENGRRGCGENGYRPFVVAKEFKKYEACSNG